MLTYYILLLAGLILIGCVSTAPLPATLNIVPPSSDVPPEIAAFSGIWEGQLWNGTDFILVVEKIDSNKAEVIISYGHFTGYIPGYYYQTVSVAPGPSLEWTDVDGDHFSFKIENGSNKMHCMREGHTNVFAFLTKRRSKKILKNVTGILTL